MLQDDQGKLSKLSVAGITGGWLGIVYLAIQVILYVLGLLFPGTSAPPTP